MPHLRLASGGGPSEVFVLREDRVVLGRGGVPWLLRLFDIFFPLVRRHGVLRRRVGRCLVVVVVVGCSGGWVTGDGGGGTLRIGGGWMLGRSYLLLARHLPFDQHLLSVSMLFCICCVSIESL